MASARSNISKRERPPSAVYIGQSIHSSQSTASSATPPDIPDLPEPPSPSDSVSTISSGLPSPPATNSTGSGSTGDPGSIALRSVPRRQPITGLGLGLTPAGEGGRLFRAATISMRGGSHSRTLSNSTATSNLSDDIDVDDLDQEDVTARLVPQEAPHPHPHHDSAAALQRVMSLSQRNRAALNKLSSISRISSPTRNSPGPSGSGSSNSSSPAAAAAVSLAPLHKRHSHSGSETERESTTSSQHHLTLTRNSTLRHRSGTITPPPSTRARLFSAPASPGKALTSVRGSTRKRVSMVSTYDDVEEEEHYSNGRGSVRSFRRISTDSTSPTHILSSAQSKRRNPLPREFMEGSSKTPQTPNTPTRRAAGTLSRASARQSGDFTPGQDGRRQSLRGGSAESALFAARSLGLTRRDDPTSTASSSGGGGGGNTGKRRERAGTVTSPPYRNSDDRDNGRSTSLADYAYAESISSRSGGGGGRESVASLRLNGYIRDRDRDRDTSLTRDLPRSPHSRNRVDSRPPTSLSRNQPQRHSLQDHTLTERTTSSSPSPMTSSSSHQRFTTSPPPHHHHHQQGSSSTSSSHKQSLSTGSIGGGGEHTKLLLDALHVFDSHLSRGNVGGSGSGSMIGRQIGEEAQSCVYTAERLNTLLRLGTTSALEEQIDVSTSDNRDREREREVEIWKKVGGEYREAMRVSDELVRSLTGFLLDVGRVFREISAVPPADGGEGGGAGDGRRSSMSPHHHHVNGNGNGRRSAEYHPSPKFQNMDVERDDAVKRLSGGRPGSSLWRDRDREREREVANASPIASRHPHPHPVSSLSMKSIRDRDRDRDQPVASTSKTPVRSSTTTTNQANGSGSIRRYTLRDDHHPQPHHPKPSPSPTPPPPRIIHTKPSKPTLSNQGGMERSRTLPPISIPRPIPILPSESLHKRSVTSVTPSMRVRGGERRAGTPGGVGGGAGRKVRGEGVGGGGTARERAAGIYPVTHMNTPTTAVTPHTVSSSRPSPFRDDHDDDDDGHAVAVDDYDDDDDDVYDDGRRRRNRRNRRSGEQEEEEEVRTTKGRQSSDRLMFPSIRGNSIDGLSGGGGGGEGRRDRSGSMASSNGAVADDGYGDDPSSSGGSASTGNNKRRTNTLTRTATRALKTSLEGAIHSVSGGGRSGGGGGGVHGHPADRSAAAALLSSTAGPTPKRERRKTVTDIVWT